jgi:subtilase family serine protease
MVRPGLPRQDTLVNYCRIAFGFALSACSLAAAASAAPLARPPRAAYQDLGRAASATPMRLAVVLNYRREAELENFVERLGDPASAMRPLTAQEFRDAFAPSEAEYAQTLAALARLGLRVARTYANRTVVDVTAPAAAVERAFATRIDTVRRADGTFGYAAVTPVSLPAELRQTVFGVTGFDNERFKTYNRRGRRSSAKPGPLQGPDTGLGPIAIETAYDLPVLHGYDGSGEAAAVVIDADYLDADLAKYLKYFKVARTGPATVRVPVNGGAPPGLSQDSLETTLDVETIVGLAPGVAMYVYEIPQFDSADVIDAYNQVNADDKVGAVNSSFGGCETTWDKKSFPKLADHVALQGQALGIVYAAASGDSGAQECPFDQPPGGVAAPASAPHFVAVGGTTLLLRADGTRITELGWWSGGGGVSSVFKKPSYQQNVPQATGSMRILPDVAFNADPGTGVSTYIQGGWYGPTGGTSLSSPIFTALMTELAQFRGTRIGNANAMLYNRFRSVGYGSKKAPQFLDAIGDSNGYWWATKGYDAVTGIGSMDGWNFTNPAKPAVAQGRAAVVTLKYHHLDELEKLIETSSDPFSPMYGHFLTAEQFRAYFAPTEAEYAATVAALRRAGFTIGRTWENRTLVDVTLPAGNADAARRLPFVDRVVVNSTAGLAVRDLRHPPMPSVPGPSNGPEGGYGPNVFMQALNFPTLHGFSGKGANVADIIDGIPAEADIATFLKQFGIARTGPKTKVVRVNPGRPPDVDLADIDAEWLLSTAPGASFYVYEMPNYDNVNLLDAYTKLVQDNVADVANISLSRCENAQVDMALSLVPIFQQGAAQGITFEDVSFGGVSGCFVPNRLFPLIPADMADGIAVGGVNAIVGGGKILALSGMPGSGGGISEMFPRLPEQRAIKGTYPAGRNTPDMSVVSEINGNGPSLYFENGWNGNFIFANSTTVASLVAEYKQMTGHRMGAFHRTLYRLFARDGYKNGITDITSGCNGDLNGAPVCAKPGYDITAGIGSFTNTYALGQRLKR